MSNVGNAALAAGSLAGADYLTGNTVGSNLIQGIQGAAAHVGDSVNSIVSNGTAANSNNPLLGAAEPLAEIAAGGYGVFRGIKKTREHGIVRGVQEGTLASGLALGAMGLTGLTAGSALAAPLAATGLTIYGSRKAYELGSTFLSNPGENLMYGVKTPFRWTKNAASYVGNGFKKAA